jgi:hypothetical protein
MWSNNEHLSTYVLYVLNKSHSLHQTLYVNDTSRKLYFLLVQTVAFGLLAEKKHSTITITKVSKCKVYLHLKPPMRKDCDKNGIEWEKNKLQI